MFMRRDEYKARLLQKLLAKAEQNFLEGDFELFLDDRLRLTLADVDALVNSISAAGWVLRDANLFTREIDGKKVGVYGTIFFINFCP